MQQPDNVDIPAIVSEQTFALAEERRLHNKPSGERKYPKLFPPGTLTCARCGYSITHNRPFICDGQRSDRAGACDLPTFDGNRVEEKVWEFVFNLMVDEVRVHLDERGGRKLALISCELGSDRGY